MKSLVQIGLIILIFISVGFSQEVSNIHFEQVEKQIHIYYDLQGDQKYTIRVFCSTDNGQAWGNPLQKVTGEVGENQKPGNSKMIVWDVLTERERLLGEIRFKIVAKNQIKDSEQIVFYGNSGTFIDTRDGQEYKWVKIGKQLWMAENLNFKTNSGSWAYDNKTSNTVTYGRLYDWTTARNICPGGWHLPGDDEWRMLEMYLGMTQSEADRIGWRGTNEGYKLKSTSGWHSRGHGDDEVGFHALPGGYRSSSGKDYNSMGAGSYWWSSTKSGSTDAWRRDLNFNDDKLARYNSKMAGGFSVRCVRD